MPPPKEASSLLEEILVFTESLKKAFNQKELREKDLKGYRSLLLCALDQSERFANAVLLLLEHGLAPEASPILRTFFEFYISIKAIKEDPGLARRFAAFSWVRLKELTRFQKPSQGLSKREIDIGHKKAMDEFHFSSRESWFPNEPGRDPNLRDMCKKLGDLDLYNLIYRHLSDLSHANIMSLSAYDFQKASKEGGRIRFSRQSEGEAYQAFVAGSLYLMILSFFDEEFQLGSDKELEDYSGRLDRLMRVQT